MELVNRLTVANGHETMLGAGFRSVHDDADSTLVASLSPASNRMNLASCYVQHEARLLGSRAVATLGSRFEHYRVSGWEVLPNARLLYRLADRHAVWGAASWAATTPSRGDESVRYLAAVVPPDPRTPGAPATLVRLAGNPAIRTERVRAFDAGYRSQIAPSVLFELTAFDCRYSNLRSAVLGDPRVTMIDGMPFVQVSATMGNDHEGHTSGFEMLADWRVSGQWHLTGSLSHLTQDVRGEAGVIDVFAPVNESEPAYIWALRSLWVPTPRAELDCQLHHVSEMDGRDIPSYLVANIRLGYALSHGFRGAVIGRNLLEGPHREFGQAFVTTLPTKVKPSVGLQVEWHP
jgi:iron complex outermembrane receptor protein